MTRINPYINFSGNTEQAFNFYKSVFGGEFITLQRFRDTPEADRVPDSAKDKIMHVSLPIGAHNVLMGTDALEEMGHPCKPGNNFQLSVSLDTEGEADEIFASLSDGGKITVPLEKTFWGAYFGMLTDKFGIQWMVSCDR